MWKLAVQRKHVRKTNQRKRSNKIVFTENFVQMFCLTADIWSIWVCCGIPGDDRESHTHTEAAGSARCVCLSHPSASAHTPLSCTSPYKETPLISTVSVHKLCVRAQDTHAHDKNIYTHESRTSARTMTTQFKHRRHRHRPEKWRNIWLEELQTRVGVSANPQTTFSGEETERRITAVKAQIGSCHFFLLTVQIFTRGQRWSAYLWANTEPCILRLAKHSK